MKTKRILGSIVGTLIIGGLIVAAVADSISNQQTSEPFPTASPSETSQPTPEPTEELNCFNTETAVTMVKNIFEDQSATPSQVSLILLDASSVWAQEASTATGSKRDWLLKMNELALAVDSFLLTGTPEDGPRKLDQLFANLSLVSNYCE
jgi:hypothetical protein